MDVIKCYFLCIQRVHFSTTLCKSSDCTSVRYLYLERPFRHTLQLSPLTGSLPSFVERDLHIVNNFHISGNCVSRCFSVPMFKVSEYEGSDLRPDETSYKLTKLYFYTETCPHWCSFCFSLTYNSHIVHKRNSSNPYCHGLNILSSLTCHSFKDFVNELMWFTFCLCKNFTFLSDGLFCFLKCH